MSTNPLMPDILPGAKVLGKTDVPDWSSCRHLVTRNLERYISFMYRIVYITIILTHRPRHNGANLQAKVSNLFVFGYMKTRSFVPNFTEICPRWPNWQYASIVLNNDSTLTQMYVIAPERVKLRQFPPEQYGPFKEHIHTWIMTSNNGHIAESIMMKVLMIDWTTCSH